MLQPKILLIIAFAGMFFVAANYAHAQSAPVTSEGIHTIESNVLNDINYTGLGVNVAVIDVGFNVTNTEISSNIANYMSFRSDNDITAGNDTDHGTGVAEIIVDIAPDVELYLYNVDVSSQTRIFNMMDHIIERGDIDIVSMSMGWFSYFNNGTSPISQKVNEVRDNGILWTNAAGNHANKHWNGTFSDTDSDNWHNFGYFDQRITIEANQNSIISLHLTWDDPWGSSSNDYNLYLYDSTNTLQYASSTDIQSDNTMHLPRESLYYYSLSDSTYYVGIENYNNAATKTLNLFSANHDILDHNIVAGSIVVPSDATGSIAVAAVHYVNETLTDYSSRGPTQDGRIKPDLAGPTDVSTAAYDSDPFDGTSAAAPHVAGVAALIMQANPHYTPDQVRQALELTTKNYHVKNNDNGTGIVNAVNAMQFPLSDTLQSDLSLWREYGEQDWNIETEAEEDIPGHNAITNKMAHADNCDTPCLLRSYEIDLTEYSDAQLSFWRYIDDGIDANEYLKVQISSNNGTTWDEAFSWTHQSGDDDTWHNETLALDSQYLTYDFRVQFNATASSTSEAIEIDDVIISGNKPITALFEKFDNFDLWTEEGELDWRVSAPEDGGGQPTSNLHPPTNTIADADDCDSECKLVLTDGIDLTPYSFANMTLYRYIDNSLDSGEYLKIDVSGNNGTTWDNVFDWQGNVDDNDTWYLESHNLESYLNSTDFKIRAVAKMSLSNEDVMIDDIKITVEFPESSSNNTTSTDYTVYLANTDDKEVLAFSMNGAYIGDFVSSQSGGLGKVWDVSFGPDGNLYASDNTYSKIRQYNVTTGAPMGASSTNATWASTDGYPKGLAWNGNNLYVATQKGVEEFSSLGVSQGFFGDASRNPSTSGATAIVTAYDVVFCPDDYMYVADRSAGKVLYYNANSGTYAGVISGTSSSPPNTYRATGIECGPAINGTGSATSLYQSGDDGGRINEIDPTDYSLVTAFTSLVDEPYGMVMSSEGDLYIANKDDDNILKIYQNSTISVHISYSSLDDPRGVTMGPAYSSGSSSNYAGSSSNYAGSSSIPSTQTNDSPEFELLASGNAPAAHPIVVSGSIELVVSATDPEGDAITIDIIPDMMPNGTLSITDHLNGTATLAINATSMQAGLYGFLITTSDDNGNIERDTFAVQVPQ